MRRATATDELFHLATGFPLLRPESAQFDIWLDARDGTEISRAMVQEGADLLPAAERGRIAQHFEREFPDVWRCLVLDLGDEEEAEQIVVVGAIVAALKEPRAIDPDVLELIAERGDELSVNPAEILALALDPIDLWSIDDAVAVDDALGVIPDTLDDDVYEVCWNAAIELARRELWSPRHERRLARLVRRLRIRLGLVDHVRASELLMEACSAFERDPIVRTRVAAILLADSADLLPPVHELAALAASPS